jgi:hypothetical protein
MITRLTYSVAVAFAIVHAASAFEIKSQWQSTSLTELLNERLVDERIQLSDDQRSDVHRLSSEVKGAINDQLRQVLLEPGDNATKTKRIKEIVASRHVGEEEQLRVILLDHQFATLKAIWRNREIARRGMANVLIDSKDDLELNSHQIQDLRDLDDMAKEERAETLRRLEREAQERLLSTLSKDQQQQWATLLGKTIDVPVEDVD